MNGAPASSSASAAAPRRRGSGAARTIRWLLGLQIGIAVLLTAGDFLRVAPGLFSGGGAAPAMDTPVRPGDQTRRYAPRLLRPGGAPAFPGGADVPSRLTWEAVEIDGADGLRLTGRIEPGDYERFAAHLDGIVTKVGTVALHSPGGSVFDAMAIGRRLRAEGADTRLGPGDACLSACPYILAGGVERRVSRAAVVGVHQHFFGQSTVLPAFLAVEDIQRGQAEVMAYLDAMGVSCGWWPRRCRRRRRTSISWWRRSWSLSLWRPRWWTEPAANSESKNSLRFAKFRVRKL